VAQKITRKASGNPNKFRKPLSKKEIAHRLAKSKNKVGGKKQRKGTQPILHILPEKPAFVAFVPKSVEQSKRTNALLQGDIALARRLGIGQQVPDMRCPRCHSSRMGKEHLEKCPECGYEGNCVDVNDPEAVSKAKELVGTVTGRVEIEKNNLESVDKESTVKWEHVDETEKSKVEVEEREPNAIIIQPVDSSAIEKFKAKQRAYMNGGTQNSSQT
jgi:uncharacterized Zn finger protein (UPF0148 family)